MITSQKIKDFFCKVVCKQILTLKNTQTVSFYIKGKVIFLLLSSFFYGIIIKEILFHSSFSPIYITLYFEEQISSTTDFIWLSVCLSVFLPVFLSICEQRVHPPPGYWFPPGLGGGWGVRGLHQVADHTSLGPNF